MALRKGSQRLGRICDKCGKTFVPPTKYTKKCSKCREKVKFRKGGIRKWKKNLI